MTYLNTRGIRSLYHRWTETERWGYKPDDRIGHAVLDTVKALCNALDEARTPKGIGAELAPLIDKGCEAVPERAIVLRWLLEEWDVYATPKFGVSADRTREDQWMRSEGFSNTGNWMRQIFQYADRADMFMAHGNPASGDNGGDQTLMLKGKQAAMKMSTTLLDSLTSMIRVFGNPPAPGPSGEIKEWGRKQP